jgi:hypothetical protein
MSICCIEGFEGYGTTDGNAGSTAVRAIVEGKWTGKFSESAGPRVYDGWGSGKGFAPARTGPYNFLIMPLQTTDDEVIVGFAFKPPTNPGGNYQLLNFSDAREGYADGRGHVTIYCRLGRTLVVYRDNNVWLGDTRHCLRPNRWNYIEVRVKVHDTTGEVEIKVDGQQGLSLTSQDTRNGGNLSEISEVWFYSQLCNDDTYEGAYVYDDIYIVNTGSGTHTTFLGPTKIEGLFPSSEGDNIDFSPSTGTDNSATIDENPGSAADYNSSSTSTDYDLLELDDLSILSTNIRCVQVNVDFHVTDPSPYGLKPTIKSGTTEDDGDEQTTSDDASVITKWHLWDEDPDTAAAWTAANIEALQAGYELA